MNDKLNNLNRPDLEVETPEDSSWANFLSSAASESQLQSINDDEAVISRTLEFLDVNATIQQYLIRSVIRFGRHTFQTRRNFEQSIMTQPKWFSPVCNANGNARDGRM